MNLTRLAMFVGPIILLILTAIAGYAFTRINQLWLPVPQTLSLFTVLLPLFSALTTLVTFRLLRPTPATQALLQRSPPILTLSLLALLTVQLIYETIIATLALTYLVPSTAQNCALDGRWATLFSGKNEDAIRTIQQTFQCCGFNSVRDRAWPFPRGNNDADGAGRCVRTYGYTRSCAGPWRHVEQVNAGWFLLVAVIVFLVKVFSLFMTLRNAFPRSPWTRAARTLTGDPSSTALARHFTDECHDCETGNEHFTETAPISQEPYRDDVPPENGNRPRIEPSGLIENGQEWRRE